MLLVLYVIHLPSERKETPMSRGGGGGGGGEQLKGRKKDTFQYNQDKLHLRCSYSMKRARCGLQTVKLLRVIKTQFLFLLA